MPISDRFIHFLKVELNDFLGKYAQEEEPLHKNEPEEKSKTWYEGVFDYFQGESTSNNSSSQDAHEQAQDQWRSRQERRSRRRSNFKKEEGDAYQNDFQGNSAQEELKYYQTLDLTPGADWASIKRAYKQLMKKYHPDRFAQDPQKQEYAKQLSQKINEAYAYFQKKYSV